MEALSGKGGFVCAWEGRLVMWIEEGLLVRDIKHFQNILPSERFVFLHLTITSSFLER